MSTSNAERIDSQRPRILRLYNLYRVILGFGLTLLVVLPSIPAEPPRRRQDCACNQRHAVLFPPALYRV